MTLRERYEAALVAQGWRRAEEQRSRRYITLVHPVKSGRVYLGLMGSVRVGGSTAHSIPMNATAKARLLSETT